MPGDYLETLCLVRQASHDFAAYGTHANLSHGRPAAANDNFHDDTTNRTREVWQPRLGRDLSHDEAKQIAANVTGFFAILVEWSRADLPDPANDNGNSTTTDDEGVRHDR